jgi:hypothetical protein
MRSKVLKLLALIGASLMGLTACTSGKEQAQLEPQRWNDMVIGVEFRPVPLRPGMNEFMVIATHFDRTRAHDMVVAMRSEPDAPWQQAIQDGKTGVYRRAVRLHEGEQTLYVQLRRGAEETVLEFPVRVGAALVQD